MTGDVVERGINLIDITVKERMSLEEMKLNST